MGHGMVRRFMERLFASPGDDMHRAWTRCPLCGVGVGGSLLVAMRVSAVLGPLSWVPTEDDVVAACPLHQLLERSAPTTSGR